ncbi:MAG: hypothetical protein GY801_00640 [bacterium]|nr:hypothetical protein [bacterium]
MSEEKRTRKDRWFLLAVLALFFIGIGIRSYDYVSASKTQIPQTDRTRSFSPNNFRDGQGDAQSRTLSTSTRDSSEPDLLLNLAPYLTEGGLSFFLGFCIGYFLRLVTRTAMLLIGGIYCCLILLSHYGIITVDWGSFQHILQQILLNTQEHMEDLKGLLTIGIPSVAMGGIGIWRGLKKP